MAIASLQPHGNPGDTVSHAEVGWLRSRHMRSHALKASAITAGDQAPRQIEEACPQVRFPFDPPDVSRRRGVATSLGFVDSNSSGRMCCLHQSRMPLRRHASRLENKCENKCNASDDDRCPEPQEYLQEETAHGQLHLASDRATNR